MAPEEKNHHQTINVAKRNWQAEIETAQTYRDLAERERDEKRKGILLRMAEAEERHAQRWEAKLKELGAEPPVYNDTIARRLNRWWNKIAGAEIAIHRMEATEERQEAEFHDQAERACAGEHDVQEFLRKSALEEKAHARVLSAMAPPANPRTALDKILKRERWHGRGGSWVADAIYGANDGLGAVFGIVSGVAGATNNQQHFILISGLAGMLASTLSMGAGAYLAAKSEAEVYEAEISRERAEVEENPEEEIEEMSLCYRRSEIAHHHAFMVGIRSGDDLDWHHRCCSDLRPRARLWSLGLEKTFNNGSNSSSGRSAGCARSTAHLAEERRVPDRRSHVACRHISRAGKERVRAVADGPELHARHHVGPGGLVSTFKNSGNRLDVAERGDDGLG